MKAVDYMNAHTYSDFTLMTHFWYFLVLNDRVKHQVIS